MDAENTGDRRGDPPAESVPRREPPPHLADAAPPDPYARLKAILDALPDILFVLDRDGRILDYHAPNPELLYADPADFLGRNIVDMLPAPAAGIVRQAFAEAVATGHHRGATYPLPGPDGDRWFELSIAAQAEPPAAAKRFVAIARDVTDRLRADDARRESERNYCMLTEGMQDVVWILDVEARRFTYVSPSVERLRGYTAAEVLAQPLEQAWIPAENARMEEFTRRSLADFLAGRTTEDTYLTYEVLQPCKDGSVVASEIVARLVRNPRTGRIEAHGVTRDVSARKRAEAALRDSEQAYRMLTEGMQDVVWVLDVEARRFTYVSPSVERLRGYTAAEVLAQPLEEAWIPEERERLGALLQGYVADFLAGRITASTYVPIEFFQPCKDGSAVPSEAICHLLRNARTGRLELHGVTRDLSARKHAEDALRESEIRFEQVARQSRAFVWEVDAAGLYMFVSPVVEDVLGYRPDEIAGRLCFYDLHPEENRAAFWTEVFAAMDRRDSFRDYENPMVAKDGRTVWVSTNAIPLLDAAGVLLGYRGVDFDVTERKRAKEALRESEARARAIHDNLPGGLIYQIDSGADGRQRQFTFISQGVEPLHGVAVADALKDARTIYGQVAAEDLPRLVELEARAIATMSPFQAEVRIRLPSGQTRWSQFASAPRRLPNGHLVWDGIEIDVTDRKRAEEALRESEARFAATAQASRSFVWEVDPAGLYTHVGEMVFEVLGYRPEDLVGKMHFYDLLPAAGREELKQACLDIMARRESPRGFENANVAKDGRLVWVSSSARPLFHPDGSFRGYQGIDTDVTARKLAEEALRESEARFTASTKASRSYVWQVDPEGLITYVSPMVEEVLGRRPEEIVGHLHFYDLLSAEDRAEMKNLGLALMARRKAIRGFENRNVTPDGRLVWVSSSANPLFGPDGTFLGYQGIDTDVSARKQAEEALKTSEIRYRGLIDFAVDGILLGSPDGVILEANACMCALAGRTRPELVGMHVAELFAPETRDEDPLRFDLVRQGETVTRVCKIIRPDASAIFVEMHSKQMPDGTYQSIFHDITQRRQAEEALRRSETKYRQLHESMRDPFASTDLKGNLLDFNPAFVELLGYTRAELLRLNFRDITPRKWQAQDKKIIAEQVRKRGFSSVYEKEYVRKDGSVVPVELRTMLVCDAGGKATGMSAVIRDVSERRQAEQALRESEAKYRRLLAGMQEAFVIADMEGRLVECNPAFESLIGYGHAEVARLHYADVTPAKWRAVDARAFKQVLRNGSSGVTEKEYIRKDGTVVPVEMTGTLIRDTSGKPVGISAIIHDVTERKRAEQALQAAHDKLEQRVRERTAELMASQQALAASEEQFRQMAESIQEVFWLLDVRTGQALYVSPAFEAIWGRPRQTLHDGLAQWLATLHPDDRGAVQRDFERGVRTGTFTPLEYRILWPDGSVRWIRDSAWGIRDRRGRVVRVAGVFRDITDQRRLESEILQAAEAERQRIGRDLHDGLGQSLTAIGYLADAVREDLARARRPEAAAVKKLGRLIGQTAAQSHALARGLLLADLKRDGLAAALQELAFRTQELFGVACRYSGPAVLPPLDVHVAGQLYRIAQEAATNAAKHGHAQRIDLRLAKERRGLLLAVRDNGRGLPARKKSAPGLGLDIMRYRAGLIGAALRIESQPRRGATVFCLLPRAAPARKKQP